MNMGRNMELTRRGVLSLMAGASAGAATLVLANSEPPAYAPPEEGLGALAARAGIEFGASVSMEIFADTGYRRLYLEQARILTSDTALKFASVRGTRATPNYADADALIAFAAANDMKFRGHCLIWNESNPGWVSALSKTDAARLLDQHIDETVGRYAGRMHSWDVVNEPFWPDHHAPGGFRRGPWHNALGPAYIGRALRRAAGADPAARLVINEAFCERGDPLGLAVREGMIRLIDDLQHEGAPLHAIALEAHLQPQHPADDDGFVRFLEKIAARGLDIYLSELDIDDSSLPREAGARDAAAAKRVGAFLDRALSVPAVKVVECWQLSDRYSWYADPQMLRGRTAGDLPRPLPFDRDFSGKPMRQAISAAFRERARA